MSLTGQPLLRFHYINALIDFVFSPALVICTNHARQSEKQIAADFLKSSLPAKLCYPAVKPASRDIITPYAQAFIALAMKSNKISSAVNERLICKIAIQLQNKAFPLSNQPLDGRSKYSGRKDRSKGNVCLIISSQGGTLFMKFQ